MERNKEKITLNGHTRFAVLEEEDIIEEIMRSDSGANNQELGEGDDGLISKQVKAQIKTRGKRPAVHISEKQIVNMKPMHETGSSKGRDFQRSDPNMVQGKLASRPKKSGQQINRAATCETHVVVRGNNSDKSMEQIIV